MTASNVLQTFSTNYILVSEPLIRIHLGCALRTDPSAVWCMGRTTPFDEFGANGGLLCAVARDREVGVDVEQIHADLDWPGMARCFFCPAEMTALAALPPEQGRREFHALWSRKEALLKGLGTGFALAPDKVELPVWHQDDPYFTGPRSRRPCFLLVAVDLGGGPGIQRGGGASCI